MECNLIKPLAWDSEFFNMKIGSVAIPKFDKDVISQINEEFNNSPFELIYLFIESQELSLTPPVTDILPKPIDIKVTYAKSVTPILEIKSDIKNYTCETTQELFELAKLSGQYSRFKTEPKFSQLFHKFYEEWIENSVNGLLANRIFVYKETNKVKAFVTIKNKDGIGSIGLIAVDSSLQGKGIGKQLLHEAEKWYYQNNINFCEVVTQASNQQACRFYEAAGYVLGKVQFVYHLRIENL